MGDQDDERAMSAIKKRTMEFAFGGIACMTAACVTNPIDVIKTRLQIQGELAKKNQTQIRYKGFLRGGYRIILDEGVLGLYKGLFPSILREGTYSTLRMGGYEFMKGYLGAKDPKHTPLWIKFVAGGVSGSVGAAIANPTDLVKVRMQAQGVPGKVSYSYPSTMSAFKIIYQTEGIRGLYVGVWPTTYRAAILTASQLASYDHIKHFILNTKLLTKDGPLVHFTASIGAGFIAAACTSPFDVIKTRVMNQPVDEKGKGKIYKNSIDCCAKIIKFEGPMGLYKGFIPNWLRIGPHTITTFLVLEQLRKLGGLKPI